MSKIRVYELARELKVESKLLVNKLKDLGIDVSSHQSTLSADQVVRIKREMSGSGGTTGEAAVKASRPSPSVIRRRRGADEAAEAEAPEESVAAAAHIEEEPEAPVVEEKRVEVAPEPKVEVEKPKEKVAAAPAVEPTPAPEVTLRRPAAEPPAVPREEHVAEAAAERPEPAQAEPEKVVAQQVVRPEKPTSTPPVPESRSMSRPQEMYDSAKIVRRDPVPPPAAPSNRPPQGAATIIRRATPEEQEQRSQPRQSPIMRVPPGGGPIRRDGQGAPGGPRPQGDDRGPRPAFGRPGADRHGEGGGIGFRKPAIPTLDIGGEALTEAPGRRWEDVSKSKDRDKKKSFSAVETEEAAAAAAKKAQKTKRDQVNMRSLLNQVATLEEEDGEELPAIDVEAPPVIGPNTKKVYTPSAMNRKKDLKRRKDLKKTQITTPRASYRVVKMGHDVTVGELAKQLSVKSGELIKKLMGQGVMATINQSIDFDTATLIANEYGFEVKSNLVSIEDILSDKRKNQEDVELVERPPIVTIMGHVDHGKTSILDAIRKAKVAASEAGGITQHIGAYTVEKDGKAIAFLDTPGHEAFSSMRSRGAKVTDIVVLVVAADDGVMPQTVEAISHARAANVPIIVAINKIDKPNKNFDRINAELAEHGIQSEDWGGENQFVKVSALQGIGIEELLDAILLQAEVLELRTPVDVQASGVVVEAHLDKGRGPVATIMVQKGVLKIGDFVVAGTSLGRVRAMHDHTGKRLKEAGPSTPVEVVGLAEVPKAGDQVDAVEDEKTGKEVADWRKDADLRSSSARSSAATLDQLLAKVKTSEAQEVPVIIKADTQGSVEAISEALLKLNTDRVRNRIVHKAVGGINESDISLATTSGAVIVGFNVRAARGLDDLADKSGTLIKYFSVIYDIVDTLKSIMAGKLPPVQKEVIQGHAEVRQTIKVPKIGLIAGSSITDGKVTRGSQLRLIRDNVVIFSGKVGSLRRFKDDVKEVVQGYECGIGIEGFSDVREGDVIETFIIEETAAAL